MAMTKGLLSLLLMTFLVSYVTPSWHHSKKHIAKVIGNSTILDSRIHNLVKNVVESATEKHIKNSKAFRNFVELIKKKVDSELKEVYEKNVLQALKDAKNERIREDKTHGKRLKNESVNGVLDIHSEDNSHFMKAKTKAEDKHKEDKTKQKQIFTKNKKKKEKGNLENHSDQVSQDIIIPIVSHLHEDKSYKTGKIKLTDIKNHHKEMHLLQAKPHDIKVKDIRFGNENANKIDKLKKVEKKKLKKTPGVVIHHKDTRQHKQPKDKNMLNSKKAEKQNEQSESLPKNLPDAKNIFESPLSEKRPEMEIQSVRNNSDGNGNKSQGQIFDHGTYFVDKNQTTPVGYSILNNTLVQTLSKTDENDRVGTEKEGKTYGQYPSGNSTPLQEKQQEQITTSGDNSYKNSGNQTSLNSEKKKPQQNKNPVNYPSGDVSQNNTVSSESPNKGNNVNNPTQSYPYSQYNQQGYPSGGSNQIKPQENDRPQDAYTPQQNDPYYLSKQAENLKKVNNINNQLNNYPSGGNTQNNAAENNNPQGSNNVQNRPQSYPNGEPQQNITPQQEKPPQYYPSTNQQTAQYTYPSRGNSQGLESTNENTQNKQMNGNPYNPSAQGYNDLRGQNTQGYNKPNGQSAQGYSQPVQQNTQGLQNSNSEADYELDDSARYSKSQFTDYDIYEGRTHSFLEKFLRPLQYEPMKSWYYSYKFHTLDDIHLNSMDLHNGYHNKGNPSRLANALLKALRGDDIHMAIVGGSISAGAGVCDDMDTLDGVYFNVLRDWWEKTITKWTGSKLIIHNAAVGAMESLYQFYCMPTQIGQAETSKLDIVLWEMSVNDRGRYGSKNGECATPFPPGFAIERLTRHLSNLPNYPAIIFINFFARGFFRERFKMNINCENAEDEGVTLIAQRYGIPSLSWKTTVCPAFLARKQYFSIQDLFASDNFHPSDLGHAQMSILLINYVRLVFKQLILTFLLTKQRFTLRQSDITLPAPYHSGTAIDIEPVCWTNCNSDTTFNNPNPLSRLDIVVNDGFQQCPSDKEVHVRKDMICPWHNVKVYAILQFRVNIPQSVTGIGRDVIIYRYVLRFPGTAEIWLDGQYDKKLVSVYTDEGTCCSKADVVKNVPPGQHIVTIRVLEGLYGIVAIFY